MLRAELRSQSLTAGHSCCALCRPVFPSFLEDWELQAQHTQEGFICLAEVLGQVACVFFYLVFFSPPTIFSWFQKEAAMESR